MSLPDNRSAHREIVRALTEALEQALTPHPARGAIGAARDAAQLLSLVGLDSALRVLHAHADHPWPNEFLPVVERLRRIASECASREDLTPLRSADRELGALAAQLEGLEWIESGEPLEGGRLSIPTLSLADVLEDLPHAKLVSSALQQAVRLRAPVAAALRAALDWLLNERVAAGAMRITAQDSVLEISCEHIDYSGLRAADQVLAAVGANLGPAAGGTPAHPGSWMLRVPTVSIRPSYLMLVQGHLKLALPWHSVIRLCIVPAAEIETNLRGLEIPVLDPMAPLNRASVEYPVAMVAHGLKRAYVVADRLVWRLSATPFELDRMPPHPGLSRPVRTEEGEVYWVVDPASLLAAIDSPRIPEPAPTEIPEEDLLPTLGPENVEPLPGPEVGSAQAPGTLSLAVPESTVGWPQAVLESAVVPLPESQEGQRHPEPEGAPDSERQPGHEAVAQTEPAAETAIEAASGPEAVAPSEPQAEAAVQAQPPSEAPVIAETPPIETTTMEVPSTAVSPPWPIPRSRSVQGPASTSKHVPAWGSSPQENRRRRFRPKTASPGPAPKQPERERPIEVAATGRPDQGRRALVVEDSITARIFLARMLEQRGFTVQAVSTAAEMLAAMKSVSFGLICVDIELPDARGKDLLDVVLERQAEHSPRAAVVVLVRDSADLAIAAAAGTARALRKPFDRHELERLLARLDFDGGMNR